MNTRVCKNCGCTLALEYSCAEYWPVNNLEGCRDVNGGRTHCDPIITQEDLDQKANWDRYHAGEELLKKDPLKYLTQDLKNE